MARRAMREELIHDISKGNLTERKSIGPCERLRGLAYSGSLASAIKRLQTEVRGDTISACSVELDKALQRWTKSESTWAMEPKDRAKVCLIAVMERAYPLCGTCNGKGSIYDHGKLVVRCETCAGSGKRKFTHKDWRRIFGRALAPEHEAALDEALTVYGHHDMLGEVATAENIWGDEV